MATHFDEQQSSLASLKAVEKETERRSSVKDPSTPSSTPRHPNSLSPPASVTEEHDLDECSSMQTSTPSLSSAPSQMSVASTPSKMNEEEEEEEEEEEKEEASGAEKHSPSSSRAAESILVGTQKQPSTTSPMLLGDGVVSNSSQGTDEALKLTALFRCDEAGDAVDTPPPEFAAYSTPAPVPASSISRVTTVNDHQFASPPMSSSLPAALDSPATSATVAAMSNLGVVSPSRPAPLASSPLSDLIVFPSEILERTVPTNAVGSCENITVDVSGETSSPRSASASPKASNESSSPPHRPANVPSENAAIAVAAAAAAAAANASALPASPLPSGVGVVTPFVIGDRRHRRHRRTRGGGSSGTGGTISRRQAASVQSLAHRSSARSQRRRASPFSNSPALASGESAMFTSFSFASSSSSSSSSSSALSISGVPSSVNSPSSLPTPSSSEFLSTTSSYHHYQQHHHYHRVSPLATNSSGSHLLPAMGAQSSLQSSTARSTAQSSSPLFPSSPAAFPSASSIGRSRHRRRSSLSTSAVPSTSASGDVGDNAPGASYSSRNPVYAGSFSTDPSIVVPVSHSSVATSPVRQTGSTSPQHHRRMKAPNSSKSPEGNAVRHRSRDEMLKGKKSSFLVNSKQSFPTATSGSTSSARKLKRAAAPVQSTDLVGVLPLEIATAAESAHFEDDSFSRLQHEQFHALDLDDEKEVYSSSEFSFDWNRVSALATASPERTPPSTSSNSARSRSLSRASPLMCSEKLPSEISDSLAHLDQEAVSEATAPRNLSSNLSHPLDAIFSPSPAVDEDGLHDAVKDKDVAVVAETGPASSMSSFQAPVRSMRPSRLFCKAGDEDTEGVDNAQAWRFTSCPDISKLIGDERDARSDVVRESTSSAKQQKYYWSSVNAQQAAGVQDLEKEHIERSESQAQESRRRLLSQTTATAAAAAAAAASASFSSGAFGNHHLSPHYYSSLWNLGVGGSAGDLQEAGSVTSAHFRNSSGAALPSSPFSRPRNSLLPFSAPADPSQPLPLVSASGVSLSTPAFGGVSAAAMAATAHLRKRRKSVPGHVIDHTFETAQHEQNVESEASSKAEPVGFLSPRQDADSILREMIRDDGTLSRIPHYRSRSCDVAAITSHTLARLLTGQHSLFRQSDGGANATESDSGKPPPIHIIDCRFAYEYNAGHVQGSRNLSSRQEVEVYFFGAEMDNISVQQRQRELQPAYYRHSRQVPIVIFHCEFSSHRGPILMRHLRRCDRLLHGSQYPRLLYPEVYLLEGGYKQFYDDYALPLLSQFPSVLPVSSPADPHAMFSENDSLAARASDHLMSDVIGAEGSTTAHVDEGGSREKSPQPQPADVSAPWPIDFEADEKDERHGIIHSESVRDVSIDDRCPAGRQTASSASSSPVPRRHSSNGSASLLATVSELGTTLAPFTPVQDVAHQLFDPHAPPVYQIMHDERFSVEKRTGLQAFRKVSLKRSLSMSDLGGYLLNR